MGRPRAPSASVRWITVSWASRRRQKLAVTALSRHHPAGSGSAAARRAGNRRDSACRSVSASPRPAALSCASQFLCTLRHAAGDGRTLLSWMRRPGDT